MCPNLDHSMLEEWDKYLIKLIIFISVFAIHVRSPLFYQMICLINIGQLSQSQENDMINATLTISKFWIRYHKPDNKEISCLFMNNRVNIWSLLWSTDGL